QPSIREISESGPLTFRESVEAGWRQAARADRSGCGPGRWAAGADEAAGGRVLQPRRAVVANGGRQRSAARSGADGCVTRGACLWQSGGRFAVCVRRRVPRGWQPRVPVRSRARVYAGWLFAFAQRVAAVLVARRLPQSQPLRGPSLQG